MRIYPLSKINYTFEKIAYDKSISHRFAIFSMLSDGVNNAENFLFSKDTINTLTIIKKLGAKIDASNNNLSIMPPKNIKIPNSILYCGNSGTTMRLMIGFLSGLKKGIFILNGDKSLNKRPMDRIINPLLNINAKIYYNGNAPICINANKLKNFDYKSDISSAQVKTAMILAGFSANKTSFYKEKYLSRDHSENMLKTMNAPIKILDNGLKIEISPLKKKLKPLNIKIPNDPSSAFYFAVAACILPNSYVILKNVMINKTRIKAYEILKQMGANINIVEYKKDYEKIGEIHVKTSSLNGIVLKDDISWFIDEIPALAIAFIFAKGSSKITNAKELRIKESDRIKVMVENLQKCGVDVKELDDGLLINQSKPKFTKIKTYNDHRIAMSFAILGLYCGIILDDIKCIKTSFPNFIDLLIDLGVKIEDRIG